MSMLTYKDIGSLFFIGIEGLSLTHQEKKYILKYNISGISLFKRNIESPHQLKNLCQEIQSLRSSAEPPLFIAIDMEGGRVHRLPRERCFLSWPAPGTLITRQQAFHHGYSMGKYLRSLKINVNWAPCLDILTNQENQLIGDRSLGRTVAEVASLGDALIEGYQKSGLLVCAKHFPGHGNTIVDSHYELPKESMLLEELMQRELKPFVMSIQQNTSFIMMAHILFRNIDAQNPSSLSYFFVTELLKKKLKYQGVVISDDLGMRALAGFDSVEVPVKALQSGLDMLMYCNDFDLQWEALERVYKAIKDSELNVGDVLKRAQKVKSLQSTLF